MKPPFVLFPHSLVRDVIMANLGFGQCSCAGNYYCYHYLFSYERFPSDSPPHRFTEDSAWLSDRAAECLLSSIFFFFFPS